MTEMAFDMASTCRVEALDRGNETPPFGLLLASLAISNAIPVILIGPDPRSKAGNAARILRLG
jgi:hypothetical protein